MSKVENFCFLEKAADRGFYCGPKQNFPPLDVKMKLDGGEDKGGVRKRHPGFLITGVFGR